MAIVNEPTSIELGDKLTTDFWTWFCHYGVKVRIATLKFIKRVMRVWRDVPATAYMAMVEGLNRRVMPPPIASLLTPRRSALRPVLTATRLEEHAVSIAMLGPFRPYRYEMRPASRILIC